MKKSYSKFDATLIKSKKKKKIWPVTGLWNREPLKILNGINLILDDLGDHLDSFWSFRGTLFRKLVRNFF